MWDTCGKSAKLIKKYRLAWGLKLDVATNAVILYAKPEGLHRQIRVRRTSGHLNSRHSFLLIGRRQVYPSTLAFSDNSH